jgi:hypothetical protein
MLEGYQAQMNQDYGELIMAAELMGSRPHYVLMDEQGYYHVQTSGTLEEVVAILQKQLEKLERIKTQKESR